MNELKHCPCCGKKAYVINGIEKGVECDNCGLNTGEYDHLLDAIKSWNRRSDGWISVDDRLPELGNGDFTSVNCTGCATIHNNIKKSLQLTYRRLVVRGERVERWEWVGRICTWPITHWMPMPAPPEEDIKK